MCNPVALRPFAVVQPSPPSTSRTIFTLHSWNSVPVKQELHLLVPIQPLKTNTLLPVSMILIVPSTSYKLNHWLISLSILFSRELPWWLNGKESTCQCRRWEFDPWIGRIPWRGKWQPTPVFLPGKSHGQRSLAGYSPWGRKEPDTTQQLNSPTRVIHVVAVVRTSLF